ncbi:MAG: hypothetical protein EKK46_08200 [Rhodocyclaceae bacterium]|nr:MAG: hypothetical protein EKK46_08200 [Rhodocyclaceae bacterium]
MESRAVEYRGVKLSVYAEPTDQGFALRVCFTKHKADHTLELPHTPSFPPGTFHSTEEALEGLTIWAKAAIDGRVPGMNLSEFVD